MLVVTVVKFGGLAILAALWFFFFLREKEWWQLCMACLGILVAVIQLLPLRPKFQDGIAITYIVIIFAVTGILRSIKYHPKRPIKF